MDDIVLLEPDAGADRGRSPHLADFGVCALIGDEPLARKVNVDVGRVHYNRWVYVGGDEPRRRPRLQPICRSAPTLKPGGSAWFVGAGGPMGRMHVQRAIQVAGGPAVIVCTDVSDLRLEDLQRLLRRGSGRERDRVHLPQPDEQRGVRRRAWPASATSGFDDIIVLAPGAGAHRRRARPGWPRRA